ncbi:Kinesin (KAR3 subfamily) [Plasmopara halstedii]|uniref:Kinesin-like protein n=1 Tax=Plasmopara halstedii TaxID=4781 RepID=A0A0P1A890_PLAHL|nr:Kinesin (KAR3 subfamily) [Plasmopara halstedii]CEG36488.1 Kinesin (KAR3 subfamily) [Plasmopara halstedii]|eukprot:XP_024572857.1 Kinesin (KAR3 subfamily) [Plasmopara halstedii]
MAEDNAETTRKLASQLRASLSALKRDVAISFRLCSHDFGVLGTELVSALERGKTRERASFEALARERAARGHLETRLAETEGCIRVICRVRPMPPTSIGSSGDDSEGLSPDKRRKRVQVESAQELSVYSPVDGALYRSFSFSRVFHEQHSQSTVFKEVAPLVLSTVAGRHACVFAYGQTGSGKTHTMQGTKCDKGLYYRAAELIFDSVAQQQHVYDFQVRIQIVEIYNEEIYDLLAQPCTSSCLIGTATASTSIGLADSTSPTRSTTGCHTSASSMCGFPSRNLSAAVEFRHGDNGVYLNNVETVTVSDIERFHDAINRAISSRMTAKYDRSNRSHTILMFDIQRNSKSNGEKDTGRLALVDLAGSERLIKTADTPALTIRESQHINKSLAAVGDVLSALLAKEKHVPFRNSKLTHLLQNLLSGNLNRTLLLVHVSSRSADVHETINSLKFASRVSHVQMGKSRRTERAEISRLNGVVASQVSQIQTLQEKLSAELELRRKYEKRLEEYRQDEHRRKLKVDETRKALQQVRTPSPPEFPPPITSRRWSLYAQKEKLANDQGLNGIENVAENILRGNESSPETTDAKLPNNGKPSGISPPTIFSRRLSLSVLAPRESRAKGRDRSLPISGKRKRTNVSEKIRSILKKQRGNDASAIDSDADADGITLASKQVSFDLSLKTIGASSSIPYSESNAATKAYRMQSRRWSGACFGF